MELRHLRYFAAVAAHGSFNRASQILHLTQPALSRQVRDLEDEIGAPLLVRGTNAVTLTAVGEAFYEDAREVLARADQAVERARGAQRQSVVRVGYLPAAAYDIMVDTLEIFRSTVPNVRVDLTELLPAKMKAAADAGQVDLLMIMEGDIHLIPEFAWSELLRITPVLVMAADHPLARLKKIAPTHLRDLPLIGLGKDSYPGYAASIRACLREFNVTPRFLALIDDGLASLLTALQANRAAAVLGDVIEGTLPRSLILRPFSPALTTWPLMLGMPKDRANRHVDVLVRILHDTAKRRRRPGKSGAR